MMTIIGACSICGGDVIGYQGAWLSILPPPPATCSRCGAREAGAHRPVVPMVPTTPVLPIHLPKTWMSGNTGEG